MKLSKKKPTFFPYKLTTFFSMLFVNNEVDMFEQYIEKIVIPILIHKIENILDHLLLGMKSP